MTLLTRRPAVSRMITRTLITELSMTLAVSVATSVRPRTARRFAMDVVVADNMDRAGSGSM